MKMFRLVYTAVFIFFATALFAQNNALDPAAIKKQIGTVRKNTNWDNASDAKAANMKIDSLSKLLTKALQQKNRPEDESPEGKKIREENEAYNARFFEQMNETMKKGEQADILLGEVVQQEIVEQYKKEDDPAIKSPDMLESMPFLIVNMSKPGVQALIDQMPKFKGIKVLLITSGGTPVAADFHTILSNAAAYPLDSLYITGFGLFLKKVPDEVCSFKQLKTLGVFDNQIMSVPAGITQLRNLKELFMDVNPINTLFPWISQLKGLEKLGIGKTGITEAEIENIKKQLPNCQLLLQ